MFFDPLEIASTISSGIQYPVDRAMSAILVAGNYHHALPTFSTMQPFLLGIPDHHLHINSDLSIGIASFDSNLLHIRNFSSLRGFGTEAERLCLQIPFLEVSLGS